MDAEKAVVGKSFDFASRAHKGSGVLAKIHSKGLRGTFYELTTKDHPKGVIKVRLGEMAPKGKGVERDAATNRLASSTVAPTKKAPAKKAAAKKVPAKKAAAKKVAAKKAPAKKVAAK